MNSTATAHRTHWIAREEQAERLIPLVGGLYRNHGVVTSIHGRRLIGLSTIELIKAHKFARQAGAQTMSMDASTEVLVAADDSILSAASCTTNAITPVLAAIDEAYGIVRGHVETAHSYTNDQNLIDNFHKGERRGWSAALNMVISETAAAKAVAKALPELAGKLTGSSIRVPTPDVSLAILNLTLKNHAGRVG